MISIGSGQWIDLDTIAHVEEKLSGRRVGDPLVLVTIKEEGGRQRADWYGGSAAAVISDAWEAMNGWA